MPNEEFSNQQRQPVNNLAAPEVVRGQAPTIYLYHSYTKEFLRIGQADSNQREAQAWIYPAFCTTLKPPQPQPGFAHIFVRDSKTWVKVEDHRGETWFDHQGSSVAITTLGNPLKRGLRQQQPEKSKPSLLSQKNALKQQLDQDAEKERAGYFTENTGQAITYYDRANQAFDYSQAYIVYCRNTKTNQKPIPEEYPFLQGAIGIYGDSLLEVAETVTYYYAHLQKVGAEIEAVRLAAKFAIDEANTIDEAQSVYDAVCWPRYGPIIA